MAVLVLKEPDMGTASLLVMIAFAMFFAAGARLTHLFAILLATTPAVIVEVLASPYKRARVFAFLNPWKDPQNAGFHIVQSLLALGSGGIFGVGLGASRAKFFYLPEQYTDFIFSILGEELGLIGALAVVVLFIVFGYRAIKIAIAAPDRFGFFLVDRLRVDRRDPSLRQHRRGDVVVAGDRRAAAVHLVRRQLADRQPRRGRADRERRPRPARRPSRERRSGRTASSNSRSRRSRHGLAHSIREHLERALADYRARGVCPSILYANDAGAHGRMSTPGVRLMGAFHFLALSGECAGVGGAFAVVRRSDARATRCG